MSVSVDFEDWTAVQKDQWRADLVPDQMIKITSRPTKEYKVRAVMPRGWRPPGLPAHLRSKGQYMCVAGVATTDFYVPTFEARPLDWVDPKKKKAGLVSGLPDPTPSVIPEEEEDVTPGIWPTGLPPTMIPDPTPVPPEQREDFVMTIFVKRSKSRFTNRTSEEVRADILAFVNERFDVEQGYDIT